MPPKFIDKSKPDDNTVIPFRVESEIGGAGHLKLFAVDASGERVRFGCIAYITKEGRLCRLFGVNTRLGLDLDAEGRIKLEGEGE